MGFFGTHYNVPEGLELMMPVSDVITSSSPFVAQNSNSIPTSFSTMHGTGISMLIAAFLAANQAPGVTAIN